MSHPTPLAARRWLTSILLGALVMTSLSADDAEPTVTIQGPDRDEARGTQVFTVTSPYTRRANAIEILLPDDLEPGRAYPVLYILPVGGEPDGDHGDGLREVRKADAHNRYAVICVTMRFDTVPWYGSHATDPTIRHEDYLMSVVVPLIEERFPASKLAKDRLLFGFSKSGWGAVSLLLRHLDQFGAACSWDAPLAFTEADFGKVGTRPHFGTAEHMAKYLPLTLAEQHAAVLTDKPPRLVILGKSVWAGETRRFHQHLDDLAIPHIYDETLEFAHSWPSGWVPQALELFLGSQGIPEKKD